MANLTLRGGSPFLPPSPASLPLRTSAPPAGGTPLQARTFAMPSAISSVRPSPSASGQAELQKISLQITNPGTPAPARFNPANLTLNYVPPSAFQATPVSTAPYVPPAPAMPPAAPPANGGAGSSSDQMLPPVSAESSYSPPGGAFPGSSPPPWMSETDPFYAGSAAATGLPFVQPLQGWQNNNGRADAALRLGLPVAAVVLFNRGNKGIAALAAAAAAALWANRLGAVHL